MSTESKDKVQELRFLIAGEESAPVIYAHGAYGGVGPRGDVIVNLYVENWAPPKEGTVFIRQDGRAREEIPKPDQLQRTVVARVFLPPFAAKGLGEWLTRRGEEAIRAIQGAEQEPEQAQQQG